VRALYLVSVWLHLLAATVWIGGLIVVALVIAPVIRRPEMREAAARLIHFTGIRFRLVGWTCFALLLLTGLVNVLHRVGQGADLVTGAFWSSTSGTLLAVKLLVFAVILLASALHDFYVGPKAVVLWRERPGSPEGTRLRRRAAQFGRLNLLLALVVLVLAVMLVRGTP
jgi:putative copper export protein